MFCHRLYHMFVFFCFVAGRFSPQMATDGIPKLDYVIDLTYTKRYYSPHVSDPGQVKYT